MGGAWALDTNLFRMTWVLAPSAATWQCGAMSEPRPNAAGGALIALGMIGGAAVGFAVGQATPGFMIGTALGIAVAILVWLRDRR
jgi:hypothetical protein